MFSVSLNKLRVWYTSGSLANYQAGIAQHHAIGISELPGIGREGILMVIARRIDLNGFTTCALCIVMTAIHKQK